MLKYLFLLSIHACIISLKLSGQEIKTNHEIPGADSQNINKNKTPIHGTKIIVGKITDENGKPISWASITIKESDAGVACDSAGRFRINTEPENTTLEITALGFNSKKINFSSSDSMMVVLTRAKNISLDEVVVKNKPLKKSKSLIIHIIQNGNGKFTTIRISWDIPPAADQFFSIYNDDQVLMQEGTIILPKGNIEDEFKVKYLIPGTYNVIFADSKSKEVKSFSITH